MRGLRWRALRRREREAALARLDRAPRRNLTLADQVLRLGGPADPGEERARVLGAWRGGALVGLAGLRPLVLLDDTASREDLLALFPRLLHSGGMVKSSEAAGALLHEWLRERGRRPMLDQRETAYALSAPRARLAPAAPGVELRSAVPADLNALVAGASAGMAEEGRPVPWLGCSPGFRHWVSGRLPRALVGSLNGRIGFVGYADVRRRRGWLLQGIFTFRALRRRGLARAGVSQLCRLAFEAGADHVQLSVVRGNRAAERLYRSLGFKPFARLRTLLI